MQLTLKRRGSEWVVPRRVGAGRRASASIQSCIQVCKADDSSDAESSACEMGESPLE